MNELMISFKDGAQWIYFQTDKTNIQDALNAFWHVCELTGINMDNMVIDEVALRDADGNDMEKPWKSLEV